MEQKKSLTSIHGLEFLKGKLEGKKVFLRADFNVPIQNGKVMDAYRIDTTMKTFAFLKREGAITVVASHIETKDVESPTLQPVFEYITEKYPEYVVTFCSDFLDSTKVTETVENAQSGDFILFENIRNAKEKENDVDFAEYLKSFVEYYVNDAFAVSHRAHTTVSKLPSLFDADHKVAGLQLHTEITSLGNALHPAKPFVAILSGAKFGTKLPLIEKYIETADLVLVGGALYNNVLKSLGYEVGVSLVDKEANTVDTLVTSDSFIKKVCTPQYVVVKNIETGVIRESEIKDVQITDTIQDIAGRGVEEFVGKIKEIQAKTILWNGPVGNFEVADFSKGTIKLGQELVAYSQSSSDVYMILGGGDTVSAIRDVEGIKDASNIFVSTGGGAMLEFLEKDGNIPGVVSLL
ncbi:MAG: phosphoglycerate kinase [Patescibacteria group bacterium]